MSDTNNSDSNNQTDHPEYGEYTITHGVVMHKLFVEAQNEPCFCLLMDMLAESLWEAKNVNLRHWLDALKRIRNDAELIHSSGIILNCLSYRYPYEQINRDTPTSQNEQDWKEQGDAFEAFDNLCKQYFSINNECIASRHISWPAKICFPIVHENVVIGRNGWRLGIFPQPGFEENTKKVAEALCIENSEEFLTFLTNKDDLPKNVWRQYESICENAFNLLFPFPEECSELLFSDIRNVPPSETSPIGIWTFLLFNLAWKKHEYSTLRAKFASSSGNGQFTFVNKTACTMESVRFNNAMYYKNGVPPIPGMPSPIIVANVVSCLENLFMATIEAIDILIRHVESIIGVASIPTNHNAKIKDEHLKDEKLFCKDIVALLLQAIYTNVRNTHGPNEFGKDFVALDKDSTHEYYVAFVVKAGSISGRANSELDTIISQVRSAFSVPYTPPDTMQAVNISKVIVVVSGKYLDNAITRLKAEFDEKCRLGYLQFWDGTKIETLIKEHGI
ncbi:MAG: hypothetical protein FWH27_04210 [Planctomycetaceae bacterium]|nr:hypothetical protein [Planctomycetaceae bacterium]